MSKLLGIFGIRFDVEESTDKVELEQMTSLDSLQGKLAHIYNIKTYRNKFARRGYRPTKHDGIRTNNNNPFPPLNRSESYADENHIVALDGIKNLYGKFLFYRHFYANNKPTIICEGKTDNVYLKCALESLSAKYPKISKDKDGNFQVHFFNRTETSTEMLKLVEGSPGLVYLVDIYKRFVKLFNSDGKKHPVIIIVDNDDAGRGVIKKAAKIRDENRTAKNITVKRRPDYFFENLYIVKVPSVAGDKDIEDLFKPELLSTKLDNKVFYKKNTGLDR